MKSEYTAIVIGAGPAGIFAGRKLGNNGLDTLIIEKGKPIYSRNCPMVKECYHCVSCYEIEGIGGAGGYSDGKLCNGPVGIEKELIGTLYGEEVEYVNDIFRGVLGEKYRDSNDKPSNYSLGNICEEITEVVSLGTSNIREAFAILYDELPIDKISGEKVTRVDYRNGKFIVETKRGEKIKTKYLLVATGKCDFSLRSQIIDDFNIRTLEHFPTFGVRLEVPNEQMLGIKRKGNNPKIKRFYEDGEYVKTHCFCYGGELMTYICGPYYLVGGRADIDNPTPFSSINILYKSNTSQSTELIMESLEKISHDYPDNVICQDIKSFIGRLTEKDLKVKPCRGEIFGDLTKLYPSRILNALQDFIYTLQEKWELDIYGGLIHGPSAEWINPNIDVSFEMESSFPDMFFIGDTSGKTQGIVAASVTGIRAAKEILRR